jgi:integrase
MREQRRQYRDKRLYDRGGRFIWARVRDEHGRIQRESTRCTNEKAATAWADEYERKAADPGYRRAATTTLGDALRDWYAELRRRGVKEVTFGITETKLGHFARIWGEAWPLIRVENDLVLQYIDARLAEPGAARGSTLARFTLKKELAELRRMLEWARFRGTFPRDPATVIPPGFSGGHRPRKRWLPLEEALSLIRQLDERRAAQVAFILATGARRGESFRARREDIHLVDENPHVIIRGTKTDKAKGAIPVTGITHPFLVYAIQHAPGKDLLFDPWGKMVRDLRAACVRAKIEPASANDLRRSYGKWHRLAGATAEQVSLLLRHATDTLAQTTYAQISGADIGPALRQLAPIRDVPDLYAASGSDDPNEPEQPPGSPMNPASPARLELATPGLGIQDPSNASRRRSVGIKRGLARARGVPSVPVLNVDDRTVFPDEELSDIAVVFPFAGVRR